MFETFGWKTGENCFAAFYPAMLVAVMMHLFSNMRYFKLLFWGRITYYIFLFQILWFVTGYRLLPPDIIIRILVTFPICFLGGFALQKISMSIYNHFLIYEQNK